jgi:2'-5' RNA ligase
MVRWKPLVYNGKYYVGIKEYMFAIERKLTEININTENRNHELHVQIQKLKGKLETFGKMPIKVFQPTYMDN